MCTAFAEFGEIFIADWQYDELEMPLKVYACVTGVFFTLRTTNPVCVIKDQTCHKYVLQDTFNS